MDLSCIISSGDLELYVLGMLPEDEAYKIGQLALLFPEVQQEIDQITESLVGVATLAPSPSVKTSLMHQLHQLKENDPVTGSKVIPLDGPIETPSTPVIPITPAKRQNFLLAAFVIGLLACIGFIVYLTSANRQSRTELAALQQQVDTLHKNIIGQQQQNLAYRQTMQMMQSDEYQKINLTSVPGKPQALAQVFWNTQTHEVYIADVSLPQTPANKQYQLWAIVNGKPVDAGMLKDVKQMAQKMKTFEKAEAFAITLEKKGGSPTPTMEAMYVMAKV